MTEARAVLEAIALPLAEQVLPVIRPGADEELVRWAAFHHWDGTANPSIIARQAALTLVSRALICYCLGADELPACPSADNLVTQSTRLLQKQGLLPPHFFYLDNLTIQAGLTINKEQISALARALRGDPTDVIGTLYTAWVPQEARRPLGQFWTPEPIARMMTWWAIQSPQSLVLDPAFGSGIFLRSVLDRLVHLGTPPREASSQVMGLEISPVVFLLGLANLLVSHPDARPRLLCGDLLVPDRPVASILKEPAPSYQIESHQLPLPGLEVQVALPFSERFDAIVCNPPYTRHHHLPEAYKSAWATIMKQEFGFHLSRFSSLFAYFFVQASRMLSPLGRMAFITPVTVFEARYSRQVKEFLLDRLRLRALITFAETLPVFDGVDTAACITLLEGPAAPKTDSVVHVQIQEWPGLHPVLHLLEQNRDTTTEWGRSRQLDLAEMAPRRKWTLIGPDKKIGGDYQEPLSNIACVMRGIATGANGFFTLSDAEIAQWEIPTAVLRPVLTRTREAPGYTFSSTDFERLGREGKKRWLLYLTGPVAPGTPLDRYIQHGEAQGLHQRSLVKTRPFWYAMEQRDPAPIYYTYLSRRRSRFIYNQAGVLALNIFLCIYPVPAIAQDEIALKALLAVLNSTLIKDSLRAVGRSYGSDTVKIEPREMDHLPVINPLRLPLETRLALAALFDRLNQAETESNELEIRQTISRTIVDLWR